jgi:hypothetical protein
VREHLWRAVAIACAVASGACEPAPRSVETPITTRTPPACRIDAPGACRVGCDADVPKKVVDVAPDLSGLEVAGVRGVEIAEILVDGGGVVQEVCLLRGVREDIDVRAIAAIRRWRFEPARLRHSTPPLTAVPIVMTVTVPVGRL